MSYINLSAADKAHRLGHIVTDLGGASYCILYAGSPPISPDITVPSGNLLVALPCSATAGVVTYAVQSLAVVNAGTGGTNGTQTVTGTTGTGTRFAATVTVSSGVITGIISITVAGSYSVLPTTLSAEPVTGGGLTGATLALGMTAILTFNTITTTNASAGGTAGFARFATANTAGGAGVMDLDVGVLGTSVIINTTTISNGGPVVVTSAVISEA